MTIEADRIWVDGEMTLRVRGPGPGGGRTITLPRPYGIIGRAEGADVRIDDRDVGSRHAYLHLDRRGLYVVDLATRTGTRFGEVAGAADWLHPGRYLEIAGRRVELLGLRIAGRNFEPPADDPPGLLADAGDGPPLPRVSLTASGEEGPPWTVGSELLFVGRSPCCGMRVEADSAARIHAVIVRSVAGVFVVDLAGRATSINGRPVSGAGPLANGDVLGLGGGRFVVRVEPPVPEQGGDLGVSAAPAARPTALAVGEPHGIPAELMRSLPPLPAELFTAESQAAVLGWMMGVLQATQNEMLRRQEEFSTEVVSAVQELRRENRDLMGKHLRKVERIQRELAALREDVRRRFGDASAPAAEPVPALPKPPPLNVDIAAPHAPDDPQAATAWLLARVNQLDEENRSSWKELLGRIAGLPRGTS